MEKSEIQVLLHDGSFADYQVELTGDEYVVIKEGKRLITFSSGSDGNWNVVNNSGSVDAAMQERIINQLKGLKI